MLNIPDVTDRCCCQHGADIGGEGEGRFVVQKGADDAAQPQPLRRQRDVLARDAAVDLDKAVVALRGARGGFLFTVGMRAPFRRSASA